jgi:hypothetical protein
MKFIKYLFPVLIVAASLSCTEKQEVPDLPRSSSEAEGVSSEAILAFLDAVEASEHEFHSFNPAIDQPPLAGRLVQHE